MAVDLTDIRWSGSFFSVERLETLDANGATVINSADQPYDPQSIAVNYDTIVVSFPTLTLDLLLRKTWVNKTNSLIFWGFPVAELQIAKWALVLLFDVDKTPFVQNDVELWVRDGGWPQVLPDYGTVQKIAATGDPKQDYDPILFKGDIPGTNLLLDGAGAVATSQQTGGPATTTAARQKVLDFTTTPLPSALPTALGGP